MNFSTKEGTRNIWRDIWTNYQTSQSIAAYVLCFIGSVIWHDPPRIISKSREPVHYGKFINKVLA